MRHYYTERSDNGRGDVNDVIKVARQSLNRSNASRIISKQECMVELTNLPLTICSEQIENINISGAMKISWGEIQRNIHQACYKSINKEAAISKNILFVNIFIMNLNRNGAQKLLFLIS